MYNFNRIEDRWSKKWQEKNLYATSDDKENKEYVLSMFPYPSGDGLHLGHVRVYTATDVYARLRRMQGYSVLHPMGWDSFGLPTEQYAIRNNISPQEATKTNIKKFKEQLTSIGCSYDWDREINTSDPAYYKWTQWLFLQFLKHKHIYKSIVDVNWCPKCLSVLANEELEGGNCERCSSEVEQKKFPIWTFRIREYADRLLEDLDELEWPQFVKSIQREWIGKSEGHIISFPLIDNKEKIDVFTTRLDTIMGATYLILAPEHPLVKKFIKKAENKDIIVEYCKKSKESTIANRVYSKDKTGICIKGIRAHHPVNNLPLDIFVADYVLYGYGTGAIMCVPAHDLRDFEFAKKYQLSIIKVVEPIEKTDTFEECYTKPGRLVNSLNFDGLNSEEAKPIIAKKIGAKTKTTYRLCDWAFSRQRYWGEPIPLMYCGDEIVPLEEKDLPLKLPILDDYKPIKSGKQPLDKAEEWKKVKGPGGKECIRELDTMPSWAGSCWYYLRYIDPKNNKEFVSKKKEKEWMPVSRYVGGAEHIARHMIYARYWHKILYDLGYVSTKEPFKHLHLTGIVFGSDGKKMSKRHGNVISPDDIIKNNGADALRLYEMFMGPFTKTVVLNIDNIRGPKRFLEKVYRMLSNVKDVPLTNEVEEVMHFTIKKVQNDIEQFHFNTAISQMMVFANVLESQKKLPKKAYETLLLLLAPFCPFLTEELWELQGHKKSIHISQWPSYNEKKIKKDEVKLPIQINSKVRGIITISLSANKEEVIKKALKEVKSHLEGKNISKEIYVPGKIVSFVVSD